MTSNDGPRMHLNFQPFMTGFNWGVLIVSIIAEDFGAGKPVRVSTAPNPALQTPFEIINLHLAIRELMFDWSMQ